MDEAGRNNHSMSGSTYVAACKNPNFVNFPHFGPFFFLVFWTFSFFVSLDFWQRKEMIINPGKKED